MQQLSFPLKIHVRKNGLRVLFVDHEHQGRWVSDSIRAKQDDTRAFCNWIRKTFPNLPTEYKSTNTDWYSGVQRHFVAYDLTPKEFMMIKLAFQFETIQVRFSKMKVWRKRWWGDGKRYQEEIYTPGYLARYNLHPSQDLIARMAKNPDKYRKLTRNRQKN